MILFVISFFFHGFHKCIDGIIFLPILTVFYIVSMTFIKLLHKSNESDYAEPFAKRFDSF